MSGSRAVLMVAFVMTPGAAAADSSNPDLIPFGERASMLGNAGITSPRGEAVYYNPANLARLGQPQLSVSGSTYLRFDLSSDALLVLQGEDQPFEASGFIAIPSTVVSSYQLGAWTLATAVLLPDVFKLKNRVTFETPAIRITQVLDRERQSLWFGLGGARRITPDLSVGLSLFVANETDAELSFIRVVQSAPMTVYESFSNVDRSVLNLDAIAGAYWQASPRVGIGARLRTIPIRLTGSGDVYQSETVTGDEDLMSEIELEDVHVSRPAPWDVGLGLSFRPTDALELLADLNVQLPATLRTMDDPVLGVEETEVVAAPRAALAADWEIATATWLRLGLLYNRSAVADPDTEPDGVRETYVGVTGGAAWTRGRTTTAVGAFFMRGDATFNLAGSDPPREGDAVVRLYGGLLTVSYSL
ncbi:MAG TPA: hypothetical protein VFU21_13470 [Kofleriaceae bacterium]|nr:hypothetical protein [Kofleriaceae bacterium]